MSRPRIDHDYCARTTIATLARIDQKEAMSTENPYDVQVGQVWEDCDKRSAGRKVRVVAIEGGKAVVQSAGGGMKTRIRLARFRPNSTGYRQVKP